MQGDPASFRVDSSWRGLGLMQRGDCLPPGGFWLPGQPPSSTEPTVRTPLQQHHHGEEAHGLFIPCHRGAFAICCGGRKAPVTGPTCGGHCWE